MSHLPHLEVSIPEQKLTLHLDGGETREFPISSSKFGLGFEEGSHCTPTGAFVVNEKHGGGAPVHTAFKGRVASGICDPAQTTDEDAILTRILRLDGCDPENSNSYRRYIYIHGTNHEDHIGEPASMGCLRMRCDDVANLFDLVPVGSTVEIRA